MSYPIQVTVSFDFSSGPSFDPPFQIGISRLGIGVLGAGGTVNEVVNISAETVSIDIKRGRDLSQDKFNPGTATLRVLDADGSWNPQNTLSPYYGKLLPLRKVIVSATHNGNSYPIFAGYTLAYDYQYPKSEEIGYVIIKCVDALNLFNKSAVTTIAGASAGDTTGERINQILDQVGFPVSQRLIDNGNTLVQNDPGNLRTVLQALQDVEFTEYGAIYADATGDVVFRQREDAIESLAVTPIVFDQGSGINYSNLKLAFSDQLIFNVTRFQRVGGAMQTYVDQASVDTYFPHTITRENLLHQTDAEVLDLAKTYAANRSVTDIRIDSIVLDLSTPNYDAGIEAALGLDFFSPVTISNVQPGGSTITKTLQVFGIQHQINPRNWFTTLTTSDPILLGFIIGNTTYGVLGVSLL
jgi:hypothetical protein